MVHSNNLGNIKEKLHLQIENPPYEISDRRNCPIFYYSFFSFYAYDNYYIQCFISLMFKNKNFVTLKG